MSVVQFQAKIGDVDSWETTEGETWIFFYGDDRTEDSGTCRTRRGRSKVRRDRPWTRNEWETEIGSTRVPTVEEFTKNQL